MKHDGKYRFGSGRARSTRSRNRAQLEFEEMLVDQFVTDEDEGLWHERETLPVRFGSVRLADHLSDSTIGTAILRDEADVIEESPPALAVAGRSGDIAAPAARVAPRPVSTVAPRVAVPQPAIVVPRQSAAAGPARSAAAFSLRRLLGGFVVGACGTAAALALLNLLL